MDKRKEFKELPPTLDREKFARSIAALCAILFGVIGLLSQFVLHRNLGFWYVLISFSVALFAMGFFNLFKTKGQSKATWLSVIGLAIFFAALTFTLIHFGYLSLWSN